MICPHCNQSIKYKERNNNICSKCSKEFAFEPKTDSLQLSDVYFSNSVKKLSKDGKFFFTPQQLHFAVSRKKIRNNQSVYWMLIPLIIVTVVLSFIFGKAIFKDVANVIFAAGVFIVLWIILVSIYSRYRRKNVTLPQPFDEFEQTVLSRWRQIYGKFPNKMLVNNSLPNEFNFSPKGIIFCEDNETAMWLFANSAVPNFAIVANYSLLENLLKKYSGVPVFVLHNASIEGYQFFEKVKQQFGKQARIFDIGFRPQNVIKTNLMKFREKVSSANFSFLTSEENKWLNEGYYTPLFVMRPEKLIQYVNKKLEKRAKFAVADNSEAKAKSIGFMTWANK